MDSGFLNQRRRYWQVPRLARVAGGASWRVIVLTTGAKEPSHPLPAQVDVARDVNSSTVAPRTRWLSDAAPRRLVVENSAGPLRKTRLWDALEATLGPPRTDFQLKCGVALVVNIRTVMAGLGADSSCGPEQALDNGCSDLLRRSGN